MLVTNQVPVIALGSPSVDQISQSKSLGIEFPLRLQSASLLRKSDFLAGRYCAQHALLEAGHLGPATIDIGEHGEPCWPRGMTGSISHTTNGAAAIAAPLRTCASLGIDIENVAVDAIIQDTQHIILHESEINLISKTQLDFATMFTVAFSAKESIFKLLFPLTRNFFDFHAADIIEIDGVNKIMHLRISPTIFRPADGAADLIVKYFIHCKTVVTVAALNGNGTPCINNATPKFVSFNFFTL